MFTSLLDGGRSQSVCRKLLCISFPIDIFQAKEAYQARTQEAEKMRKECNSTKDIPALEKVC